MSFVSRLALNKCTRAKGVHPRLTGAGFACLVFWAVVGAASPARAQSTSTHFRLVSVTLDAGGEPSASTSNASVGSLGQELTVGASAGPHFILQSGFWSYLGSTVVPVVLSVSRTSGDPDAVDLTWSGNNAFYDVYSSTNCATQYTRVLASTMSNAYTHSPTPVAPVICYSVLAVAPGPVAPPGPEVANP